MVSTFSLFVLLFFQIEYLFQFGLDVFEIGEGDVHPGVHEQYILKI